MPVTLEDSSCLGDSGTGSSQDPKDDRWKGGKASVHT